MVQTRATTRKPDLVQVPSDGGEEEQDAAAEILQEFDDTAYVPKATVKKRRRSGAPPPKKRRRKQPAGELCQLNLDVLFLIAEYVHPLDLLTLARTCKSLRQLLMDKSSEFVWRSARRQVPGLPDCPADLTEPEYANLVFYARCHGCGKYARKVLWGIRRRYCPKCRQERLCVSNDKDAHASILPHEIIKGGGGYEQRLFDREQLDAFLDERNRSSDKNNFLVEKMYQHSALSLHARRCEGWQKYERSERRYDMALRRRQRREERVASIFARLQDCGYGPEIEYTGRYTIKEALGPIFKTSKPLTDEEWGRVWPEHISKMNDFRSQRFEGAVCPARRQSLQNKFAKYVMCPPPNTPTFDLLPHVTDVARFLPFRHILNDPEESGTSLPFESAFASLPEFVDQWKSDLLIQLARLVKIPSEDASSDALQVAKSNAENSLENATNKLRLACAVFYTSSAVAFPEVLSVICPKLELPSWSKYHSKLQDSLPVEEGFVIRFLKEAPFIVRACGLDPNVATAEDMDRRNARFKCTSCSPANVRGWREALQHGGLYHHCVEKSWQLVSEEHTDAIQAVEMSQSESVKDFKDPSGPQVRCLLCRPYMGDAMKESQIIQHFVTNHALKMDDIQGGVHYVTLKSFYAPRAVEMVEEDGQVTFKKLSGLSLWACI